MMKELTVRESCVVTRVALTEERPVPAERPLIEAALGGKFYRLGIVAFLRGVTQESLDLGWSAPLDIQHRCRGMCHSPAYSSIA